MIFKVSLYKSYYLGIKSEDIIIFLDILISMITSLVLIKTYKIVINYILIINNTIMIECPNCGYWWNGDVDYNGWEDCDSE